MSPTITPCSLREATAFIERHHRHHKPPRGGLFAMACSSGSRVVGVAIVGRPVARHLQDGFTAEVIRLASDEAWGDAVNIGWAGGAWARARELGLRGVDHAAYVLNALRRSPVQAICSALYSASWRAVRAMGYKRLVTYTLPEEGGASLRAAGWICVGEAGGGSWSREGRPRVDMHPTQTKLRWSAPRAGK